MYHGHLPFLVSCKLPEGKDFLFLMYLIIGDQAQICKSLKCPEDTGETIKDLNSPQQFAEEFPGSLALSPGWGKN
jgi:hypothetical protein